MSTPEQRADGAIVTLHDASRYPDFDAHWLGRDWWVANGARTVAFHTTPYPARLRAALLGVSNTNTHTAEIARLHFLLGELYARAVRDTCRRKRVALESVELVGCHEIGRAHV